MNNFCKYFITTWKKIHFKIILIGFLILIIQIIVIYKNSIKFQYNLTLSTEDEYKLCNTECGSWKNASFTNFSARGTGTCSTDASKRGFNQSVITFTFYGSLKGGREYFMGIEKNIELLAKFYPDWVMQIYHNIVEKEAATKLCEIYCKNREVLDICYAGNIPGFGNVLSIHKFMWRFLSLADPHVSYMMSRDLDSRFTEREAAAVREWLQSGAALHVMRDHIAHQTQILGGLWGAKVTGYRNIWLPLFAKLLKDLQNKSEYNEDQIALQQVFKVAGDIPGFLIQHDSYYCRKEEYLKGEMRPFPTRRLIEARNFVGSDLPLKNTTIECPKECRKNPDWTLC